MGHSAYDPARPRGPAWNTGKFVCAKKPLKPRQLCQIRLFHEHEHRLPDGALFDLAIDSKPRGCDIVKIKIGNLVSKGQIRRRAIVIQQKTGRPVEFEPAGGGRRRLSILGDPQRLPKSSWASS